MSVDYRPDYDPADVDSDYGHTGGNITVPTFTGDTRPFRFWCQKALPLVYDDSLSYYEVLCKMADYMNNFVTDLTTVEDSMTEFGQQFVINQQFLNSMADQLGQNVADLEAYINDRMNDFMTAYTQLQTYVNNYFDNLDVQEEINAKLDEMASDGTLNDLFDPVLETWMQQKTAQIDAAIANQDTIQAAQNSRISVLEGRMDTFSGLPSGSTSGNAELLDIRTNFLGETYPTAGDAVRASDMIASGFLSIPFTRLEEWNGNESSNNFDTIQFDVSAYKGGHVVMIANMDDFILTAESIGVAVFATNVSGKTADQNAHAYALTSTVFPYYSVIPTQITGEERVALFFSIPEDFNYQYLKMGYVQEIPNGDYTQPAAIVYANSWSKTQVDPTLEIAGAAADAKATGDALSEVNERLGFLTSFDQSKSGTTGGTYGQFTLNVNRAISPNSQYIINMEMTGATLKDCTVYGIISAGTYSDPLIVFTELNKNFVFTAPAQYTGFYLYTNANETSQAYSAEFHFTQIDSRNQMIDIAELQTDVNYLNENAVTLSEAVDFATGSVSDYSNTGTGNNWSSTSTGLAVSAPITNAKKLINVAVNATENSSFYFGLLTKSENTGTVKFVKQISVQTGNTPVTVNFDLDPTETYYPFIRMISGKVTFAPNSLEQNYYSFSKGGTIAVNNTVSLTTTTGNGLYIIKCEVLYDTPVGGFGNTITVAKTGGDYHTISEAVANANGTAEHPVTIIIYPGIYDEVVRIGANKYVSLVGVNRDTCIIRDKSGKYANSPLLASGTFTVENLTFIATHEDAGSWYPTWVTGQNSTFASYCVHVDGSSGTADNQQLAHFINCTFYSECCHCAGLGIHPYQTLCFENCEFVRYVTDSNYLNDGYQGAVGCHSEVTGAVEIEAEEHLILKNCEFTFNGDKALQLWHYHAGSPMTVTAIGCTLEDGTGTSNVVYYRRGTKADYLTKKCHGNNTDELNYSAS